jgi:hypothetical protein
MARGLDGYFYLFRCYPVVGCAVLRGRRDLSWISGGYGVRETPLPIPNREVKPHSADGTWLARARESRTPPVCRDEPPSGGSSSCTPGMPSRSGV